MSFTIQPLKEEGACSPNPRKSPQWHSLSSLSQKFGHKLYGPWTPTNSYEFHNSNFKTGRRMLP